MMKRCSRCGVTFRGKTDRCYDCIDVLVLMQSERGMAKIDRQIGLEYIAPKLTGRIGEIVSMRVAGTREATIGEKYGISHQRVSQICADAARKGAAMFRTEKFNTNTLAKVKDGHGHMI